MTPTADDMKADIAALLDWMPKVTITFPVSTVMPIAGDPPRMTATVRGDETFIPAAIRRAIAAEAALAAERQARIDAEDRHCRAEARCVEGIRLFACDEAERKRLEARVKELEDSMFRSLARAGKDVMDGLRSIELRERLAAAEARVK